MDDLVLIQKVARSEVLKDARTGRPVRAVFGLRNYVNACMLALPVSEVNDGDRIDFFLSKAGFAVQIGPYGGRSISGKRSARTASVPPEIREHLKHVSEGSHNLIVDQRPDGIWFFPFSQFITP